MNKVMLIGRLANDPDLRFTAGSGTAVARFSLAVDRRFSGKDGQKEADFIRIVAWNKAAEIIANYMSKGRQIAISGRIQTGSYDDKDGKKVYTTEVIVEDFQFLDNKGNSNGNAAGNQSSKPQYGANNEYAAAPDFGGDTGFGDEMTPIDDGDIPF